MSAKAKTFKMTDGQFASATWTTSKADCDADGDADELTAVGSSPDHRRMVLQVEQRARSGIAQMLQSWCQMDSVTGGRNMFATYHLIYGRRPRSWKSLGGASLLISRRCGRKAPPASRSVARSGCQNLLAWAGRHGRGGTGLFRRPMQHCILS